MLATLRSRLVLSHVLPLFVIVPLVGISLVYALETQVLLPNLAGEVSDQAFLVAELTRNQPGVWSDPVQAGAFVERVRAHVSGRLMLLDLQGRLLASSDQADTGLVGQPIEASELARARLGEDVIQIDYSRRIQAEIIDGWVPARGADGGLIGIVRLSQRLATVQEQFLNLRYVVTGVLGGALALGTAVGLLLALNMEQPVRRLTVALRQLVHGQRLEPLSERGPAEISLLVHSFNTLLERLHNLEQTRHLLLANLIHELGRPLGALYSAVQALLRGADAEVGLRTELLAGMEEEINRLRHLLDNLAGLHDQVLGRLELERRVIEPATWIAPVLAPWRQAIQSKGLRWQVTLAPHLPALSADPDRLAQALGNLLSNALKYTPPGGSVSVEVTVEDGALCIAVADSGPGIPIEDQERIFVPFHRGPTTGRQPRGMGLGLNIARELVVAHGGRLDLRSTPGQGSRFTIRLPLDAGPS